MPRLTPIYYKQFEKFLFREKCRYVRQKGDHKIYNRPGLERPLVIPAEKDIPVFIIKNNLRVLVSVEEYLKVIKKL